MPLGDRYARSFADLSIAAGNAQADSVRHRGALWGQSMSDLSRLPAQVQQARLDRQELAQKQEDRTRQAKLTDAQIGNLDADNRRLDAQALTEAETAKVKNARMVLEDMAAVYGTVGDQASLLRANAQLVSTHKIDPKALVQVYDPAAVEQIAGQAMTAAERAAALLKAHEQRQKTNQEGVRRMVGERVTQGPLSPEEQRTMQGMAFQEGITVPGDLLPKAPTAGSFEEYSTATPERKRQIEADRKGYQQADDRPITINNRELTPNAQLSATMQLRDRFVRETAAAATVKTQLDLMKSSLAAVKSGAVAAGSQGVLVTFQKILDPTSVVRESEYARSASGLSLLSRIEGKWQTIQKGGAGVPVRDLEDFVALGEQFMRNQASAANQTKTQIDNIATEYGLKPSNITREINAETPPDVTPPAARVNPFRKP